MRLSTLASHFLASKAGAGLLVAAPLTAAAVAVVATVPSASTESSSSSSALAAQDSDSSAPAGRVGPSGSSSAPAPAPAREDVADLPEPPASQGGLSGMGGSTDSTPLAPPSWTAQDFVPAYNGAVALEGESSLGSANARTRTVPVPQAPNGSPSPKGPQTPQPPQGPAPEAPRPAPPQRPVDPVPVKPTPIDPPKVKPIPIDPPKVKPIPILPPPVTPTPVDPFVPPTLMVDPDDLTCLTREDVAVVVYTVVLSGEDFTVAEPFELSTDGTWRGSYHVTIALPAAESTSLTVDLPSLVVTDQAGVDHAVPGAESFDVPLADCQADQPATTTAPELTGTPESPESLEALQVAEELSEDTLGGSEEPTPIYDQLRAELGL